MRGRQCHIVGAGIAGLTLAYLLVRKGLSVRVFEAEETAGGLARSFRYDGHVFDIGPHRFHTDDPEVLALISEVLGPESIEISRRSAVWMFGKYFEWPLEPKALASMPTSVLMRVAMDFLSSPLRGPTGAQGSFERQIKAGYGPTLYDIFFAPYTEKFLRMPVSEIAAEWASTGIERAAIDRGLALTGLWRLLASTLRPRPPLRFVYPRSGGIETFCQRLTHMIREQGGEIELGERVTEASADGNIISSIKAGNIKEEPGLLVWSGPLTELLSMLGHESAGLRFLPLVLYNYRLSRPALIPYQWCYYGGSDIPFNRVSIPERFSPSLTPDGKGSICVEVTCALESEQWASPERLDAEIRKALVRTRAISSEDEIEGLGIERIRNAYPVYTIGYRERLDRALETLSQYRNLRLLGRCGTFWYNNMDHSIRAAMDASAEMLRTETP